MDAELMVIKQRLDGHDKRFEKDIPEAMAVLRGDMLRAFASAMEESKKSIEKALIPINKSMEPINEVVERTHTLVKWFFGSIGAIIVAVIIAFALHWLSLS